MALTYNQISAITRQKFIPKLADNIYQANPLLARLKKTQKVLDGGTSILVPLEYATLTAAGWFSGADTLDTADNQTITSAEYTWKQHYANISISRRDELINSGDSQILDFVKAKVKSAEKTLADNISTGLYNTGSDSKAFGGLRLILSASNTVGGISQTDNSWWAANVDSSTTTLSMSAMQVQFNAAAIDNDAPSVAVATRSIYNSYYALLQPQQRFVDSETAKGGFQNLMFNGIPVIVDAHQAASHLMFLNEKYLHLMVHKDENFRFEDFVKPVNQNVKVGKVYFMGALGSSNNRMHAVMSALTA
jgi:hypothetical protein